MPGTNRALINRTSDQTIGLLGALGFLGQSPCLGYPTGSPAWTAPAQLSTEAVCEHGVWKDSAGPVLCREQCFPANPCLQSEGAVMCTDSSCSVICAVRIKQAAHTGLAKVHHNADPWECAVSGLLGHQNVGLWLSAAPAGRPDGSSSMQNMFGPTAVLSTHIFFGFSTVQVFPAHWKAQITESCQHLKKSLKPKTRCFVGWGGPSVLYSVCMPGHMQDRGLWPWEVSPKTCL